MANKARVLLADSSDVALVGQWASIMHTAQFEVVAATDTYAQMLELVSKLQPKIIILQEQLEPELHIYQMIEELHEITSDTRIIITGLLMDGLHIRDLFHAGIDGYLYRSDSLIEALPNALATVMRNRKYLSPSANAEYLVAMQSPQRDWHLDPEARQILQMLAQGYRVCEIAEELGIETRRVYFVRKKLRQRFGVQTNEHLISIAAAEGFIYVR